MMKNHSNFQNLKLKLTSYGALRPTAWNKISTFLTLTELKTNENFTRKAGSLAFVAEGLLKECDPHQRKTPSIINFISANSFILNTKHNQSKYLKAIRPTKIVFLDFDQLIILFSKYQELRAIYENASADYEDGIAFREFILEEKSVAERIHLFNTNYRHILSSLRKKDIANYLNVDYDYFIRLYNKQL